MEHSSAATVAARDRILARMVDYFLAQVGTRALFLSGSLAAETADPYSDIDFRVVLAAEQHASLLGRRAEMAAEWGDVLFSQAHPAAVHSVSHFRPFVKVDTFYYRADQLVPSPWFTLPTKVLFDPEHLVGQVLEASRGLPFTPSPSEVERSIHFGLAALHEVVRRVCRDELAYAHAILDELRLAVVDADDYLNGRPWYGFSHFEIRADAALVQRIQGSYCPLDRRAMAQAALTLSDLYRSQIRCLHEKFPLADGLREALETAEVSGALREAGLIP